MIEELRYPFDSELIMRKRKALLRQLEEQDSATQEKRIAVLGGSTTADIVKVLKLFLLNENIRPSFYESEYNKFWEDAKFPPPALTALNPEIVIIHSSTRNISGFPLISESEEQVNARLEKEFSHFQSVWQNLKQKFNCIIIQNNFELPAYRLLGNADCSDIHGKVSFVSRLNERFAEAARHDDGLYINDINYLSACYGLDKWSDPFYWDMYKYCLCVPAIPQLSYNLARIIKSLCGRNKKAFALDLDNTLWGGVIGDEGVEHIEIGQESATGESYREFQSYIREHAQIGVMLNIASKNDEENALAGLNHPESVLKVDDFSVIKANWEPKNESMRQIAQTLNILPESIVFVDDNPAERELIQHTIPQAGIPQLTRVDQYIREIDRAGYFEVTTLSADDLARNQMIHENLQRSQAEQSFENYDDFLRSLEMVAEIKPFDEISISRITQLTNKTNQFNLTTRRFTQSEMEALAASADHICLYARLRDKFGDNGIISVIVGRIEAQILHMDLWLMSCRVLKRGLEDTLIDELMAQCQQRGIRAIRGYYFTTAKNAMVRDFYQERGFSKLSEDADGNSVWELAVNASYQKRNHVMKVEGANE